LISCVNFIHFNNTTITHCYRLVSVSYIDYPVDNTR